MEETNELVPWKILIVDDDKDIHEITEMTLKRLIYQERSLAFYHAYTAAEAVLFFIEHEDIAVALLDVVMESDTSGLDLVKTIREVLKNSNTRLVIRTGNPGLAPEEKVALEYDINDYQCKTELTAKKLRTVIITALRSYQSLVTIKNLHIEIDDTQKELIYALSEIAESRSIDTSHHVQRVSIISAFLAEKLGFSATDVLRVKLAASMHDLGKLAIDDKILNKPGSLSEEEFDIMKNHCLFGYKILENSNRELLRTAALIAYEHHENFDGSGYPRGLKGEEIGIFSRIVAVVDVFDALATKRAYKNVWPLQEILLFLNEQKGIKFDPVIVELFFEHLESINELIKDINEW